MNNKRASRKREALFISAFPKKNSGHWRCGAFLLNYKKKPLVMGIVNVTPDSFSDGGLFFNTENAVEHALQLVSEGADLIDIGGESTRPDAPPVSLEEESKRVLPVIERLAKHIRIPISVDTQKPEIARRAILSGASIINDVSALNANPEMLSVGARGHNTGMIFMHAKGTPQTMQKSPRYHHLIEEIHTFFQQQIQRAQEAKIAINRLAVDPGIGFGKTVKHNLTLIHQLGCFTNLGVPVLLGPSRKSFIGRMLDLPTSERLEGTAAAVAIAVFQGARILRVHDVAKMKQVVRIAEGIRKEAPL